MPPSPLTGGAGAPLDAKQGQIILKALTVAGGFILTLLSEGAASPVVAF